MSEDMSDLMNNLSNMLKNNEIPNEVTDFINNFSSKSNSTNQSADCNTSNNNSSSNNINQNENRTTSSESSPDIDIGTILKLKTIMDSMKNTKDDPRANLLMSLKPYLRDSKREKVDQYVKLFGMSKLIEVINPIGGGLGNIFGNGGDSKK